MTNKLKIPNRAPDYSDSYDKNSGRLVIWHYYFEEMIACYSGSLLIADPIRALKFENNLLYISANGDNTSFIVDNNPHALRAYMAWFNAKLDNIIFDE